ncbi:MAG TPA: STAS domain-containing protein [Usitatibacter sp.]|nr:STAS domain-containing protein [Usitatibacter sp.]
MNAISAEGEVVRLNGALDFGTVKSVLEEGAKLAARTDLPPRITVDFSAVTGVDSSAVALLLEWRRLAQAQGKALEFTNLPANLIALAKLYGVADLIQPPGHPAGP